MDSPASPAVTDSQLANLRESYPVFRIEAADPSWEDGTLRVRFGFTAGQLSFAPSVEFTGLAPGEADRVSHTTARHIIRAMAIVEAFSYWKAFCSPVIEVTLPSADEAEVSWWEGFWPDAMGEFFYRNGIDFTRPGFLRITCPPAPASGVPAADAAPRDPAAPPLVMFSGGKDSLALTYTVRDTDASASDFFLYNPTAGQRELAGSLANGGRIIEVRRRMLPELLALNDAGRPNGHTPYSAYLALAALLTGYLRGSTLVLAGNSRSDDEPNVSSWHGHPINHQWTKSREFEAALQEYEERWLPGAPLYCSPLRPLYELQIIRTLSGHMDAFMNTASCNKTKGHGWCRACAKCAWVFLATTALFGHDVATGKVGGDMFADPGLSELYEAMAGLRGAKPFECTGTEEEVRAAILASAQKLGDDLPALSTCLQNTEVQASRSLDALLEDWGSDDLMPATMQEQVRKAAILP